MDAYLKLLDRIMHEGHDNAEDRTGKGRRRVFGVMERFDLSDGRYPLVTTRKINPANPILETLMFIGGHTNTAWLHEHDCKIWDQWAASTESARSLFTKMINKGIVTAEQAEMILAESGDDYVGEIGPMYGAMWRDWPRAEENIHMLEVVRTVDDMPSDRRSQWEAAWHDLPDEQKEQFPLEKWLLRGYYSTVDQLNELRLNLLKDPYGSRHVVTALNPAYTPVQGYAPDEQVFLKKGSLMACHAMFQVFVTPPAVEGGKKRLSLSFYLRSADVPVGSVFNIAGYAFLAHLLAHVTDMDTHELIYTVGDAHIYFDQIEGVKEQLTRTPREGPRIKLNPEQKDLFQFKLSDVQIEGYNPDPIINYPVAK